MATGTVKWFAEAHDRRDHRHRHDREQHVGERLLHRHMMAGSSAD